MRKNKRKKKGFTLIEVMAGLAVFAIVTTVITSMILNVNKYNAENKNQFDANSMSRAFNEGIKSIRPIDNERVPGIKGYPIEWDEQAGGIDSNPKYYYISFNTVDELNKAIKEKLLKDTSTTGSSDVYYFKKEVLVTDKIEDLCTDTNSSSHKYGMKIAVQNKATEKVYVFDTETMDIKGGITTITERKFAISSIA